MASDIYKTLLDEKINSFLQCYDDAGDIYRDESKIFHMGEYGQYRERAFKELLRTVLPKNFGIADGFVITQNNKHTTQCDVIVYDANIPTLISSNTAQMFPAESVQMIGEIKSTMSKEEYIEALKKMAKNKKVILEGRSKWSSEQEERKAQKDCEKKEYRNKTYDTIGSFLVCNKLNFRFEKLSLNEIYGDIDPKYWHSAVLSLNDGVFAYCLDFSNASVDFKQKFEKENGDLSEKKVFPYPIYVISNNETLLLNSNYNSQIDYSEYIKAFICHLYSICNEVWKYSMDPGEYLGLCGKSIFKE